MSFCFKLVVGQYYSNYFQTFKWKNVLFVFLCYITNLIYVLATLCMQLGSLFSRILDRQILISGSMRDYVTVCLGPTSWPIRRPFGEFKKLITYATE